MEAFDPTPPAWTLGATHAFNFCCPRCRSTPMAATNVWINRRSPVYTEDRRRKWQEFYRCQCETAWWAWSDERPPAEWAKEQNCTEDDRET
ncbi:hypothetical protein H6G20_02005 [Desertifilum sp. FACHB-1129]|uniref:Uncharacterized protein n=1 Tax=Desertifilum tharense IPPAS B-1220 TaxID=1781255 RepID=A0ACD5H327_9CYAN|nr:MULTISPECIES: hypothetical protein [Desertifilum]MCD8486060.1 hypothetical protein [Desertifilum sp.]MDA0208964.1 hypothetical protein [Cyanobacteria bacterium FC1]MBD2310447.1 hypothetical protein [Desertifilum sp. FACHB-1129]MBD2321899.1 hypothetical protein [Desertifilum sp. FACHB-866]MBD2332026.1 hypothetical protein [Desertifilum sp. FACHB-868]